MSLPENHLEIAGGVGVFTLNRPRALNAISQAMFERDLPDMVERAEADADLRVLILTGRAVIFVPAPMSNAWAARNRSPPMNATPGCAARWTGYTGWPIWTAR